MLYLPLISKDISNIARIIPLNFHMPSHWHDELEIIYNIEGTFKVIINNVEIVIEQGQSIWVNSMEAHEYIPLTADQPPLLLHLVISPALISDGFEELVKNIFRFSVIDPHGTDGLEDDVVQTIYRIFNIIAKELQLSSNQLPETKWNIYGHMLELAALIRRDLQTEALTENKNPTMRHATTNIYSAIEYVQQNFADDIPLEKVAQLTGYKKSNFCKHFKNATNMSFHYYLNSYRISKACAMLGEYSTSINTIAEKVGFSEMKTFCRVFKKYTGMTPSEYRSSIYRNTENLF